MLAGLVSGEDSPWLAGGHRLPMSSHSLPSVPIHVLISSSPEGTSPGGLGLTPITSFSLNYLFEAPFSKYSFLLRCWDLGLQHTSLGRDPLQPIQMARELVATSYFSSSEIPASRSHVPEISNNPQFSCSHLDGSWFFPAGLLMPEFQLARKDGMH